MKTILTVGCEIPGEMGRYVEFNSKSSLLDADFVLFQPTFGNYVPSSGYHKGKPVLSSDSSFRLKETVEHWRKELDCFLNLGKSVFMIMGDLAEVYVSTHQENDHYGGINIPTANKVRLLSNYCLLPFETDVVESKGSSMMLEPGDYLLREYWQQFGDESEYRVHFQELDTLSPLLTTRHARRIVGGIVKFSNGGALVALPWIDFDREEFYDEGNEAEDADEGEEWNWTPEGISWENRYLKTLEALDKSIKRQAGPTTGPQWAQDDKFRTNQEIALSKELDKIQSKISELETKRKWIDENLMDAGFLKRLLFEQGHVLEIAIIEAMSLMGFQANSYRDSDSEFDVVLECAEGRCIGEAEGRDNKPIGIDKMRQLEVNILEDLSRETVSEPAKGILFGNAYRLTPPSDRPDEHFTAKCHKAAERNETALIRTCDLFEAAKTLIDEPNEEIAALCRDVIFNTVGELVRFPAYPGRKKSMR